VGSHISLVEELGLSVSSLKTIIKSHNTEENTNKAINFSSWELHVIILFGYYLVLYLHYLRVIPVGSYGEG
jgi:hypothetical protein